MPNPNLILFTLTLLMSTLSVMSTNSWISMSVMLEINMMSFIPLTLKHTMISTETSIKYFLIQDLSSSMLLLLIMNFHLMFSTSLTLMPILMKLGAPPMHFWFTNIMEGLSWMNCLILMTWQQNCPHIHYSYHINHTMSNNHSKITINLSFMNLNTNKYHIVKYKVNTHTMIHKT